MISKYSKARISKFIDMLIRTELAGQITDENNHSWSGNGERSNRVLAAAENGSDGRTYDESIEDMRETFHIWLRQRRSNREHSRFECAVCDHFDSLERFFFDRNMLFVEIG